MSHCCQMAQDNSMWRWGEYSFVHAVSMIPHAHKKFRTTLKSENHMQNKNNDTACIFKNLNIFANSNYEIRKGFSPLIRCQGRMFWWKNWGLKISWLCPFNRLTMMCSTMLTITQCYFVHLFFSSDIMVLLYYVDWYNDTCINCLVDIMWVDVSIPWS
jgi:hypothetical protein